MFCATALSAQEQMNLEDVITTVIENDVEVEKADNDLKLAKNDKFTSYVDLFPKARLEGLLYTSEGNNFDEISGQLISSKGDFASADITFYWDILNIVNKTAAVKSAENNKQSSFYNKENVKDAAVLQAIGAYLEMLQNKEQKEIIDSFLEVQEQTLVEIQEMVRVGKIPGLDYVIQNTEKARLNAAYVENSRIINEKTNNLLLSMGTEPGLAIDFEDVDVTLLELGKEYTNVSTDSLYKIALENRNDLKSLSYETKALNFEVSKERGNYYPKINLFYRFGSGYSSFNDRSFKDQFYIDNKATSYGVEVIIPIINGMKQRNQVYEKRMAYEDRELDARQLRNLIYVQISNARSNIEENARNLSYREEQLILSEKTYQLQKEKYLLGSSTARELAIFHRDLIEASLLKNKVKYQLAYTKYELIYYLGAIATVL